MSRTITIVAAATGAAGDVRIDTNAAATIGDLVPSLQELTTATDSMRLTRDGRPLDVGTPVAALHDGDVVVLGDSRAATPPLTPMVTAAAVVKAASGPDAGHAQEAAATAAGPDGTTVVHRPPRLVPPQPPLEVTYPVPPTPVVPGRIPLLASVAPLVAGIGLALLLQRWEFLAFAVMSPLVVLGQAGSDRWSARRTNRRAAAEHAAAVAAADNDVRAALAEEQRRRHAQAPDLAQVVSAAYDRTALLWHRGDDDGDLLRLRLGTGSLPSDVVVDGGPGQQVARDVPVCIGLTAGVVGICGGPAALGLTRSMLVQVATLHGPATVGVTVLAPGRAQRWAWTRWLPHLRLISGGHVLLAVDEEQVAARLDDLRHETDRHRLVVVDGVRDRSLAAALAAQPRTSVLWFTTTESELPSACTSVLAVPDQPSTSAVLRVTTAAPVDLQPDLVADDVAEGVARALAPLRDAAATAAALPTSIRWSELYDVPLANVDEAARSLARRWRAGPSTLVHLGAGVGVGVSFDLHRDGPHLLVAGTTGAGKSELLQSFVAGLVAGSSPADLSLLLVDYKGGAAFGACTRLPHTVGVLTDLDGAATSRALQSLTAELRRREQVLAAAGVPDLESWRRQVRRDGGEPTSLPRLVIVVDEFATLAEELHEFVGGLVGIAQRGRSLGVHLVLATQRPEGAVSADIRANTRLRICLAVAREAESRDVIESPRAIDISRSTPGRALLRVDGGELVEVQTARVAAPAKRTRAGVTLLPLRDWGEPPPGADTTTGPSELDLLVDAAVAAAMSVDARCPTPPWLPPLPDVLDQSALDVDSSPAAAAIGLVDRPDELRQEPLTVPVAVADPLLVIGTARSGRTSAATAIVTALCSRLGPDQLHVWAVDACGDLADLRSLPHTGAVIDAHNVEQVERLLTHLTTDVRRRRTAPAAQDPQLLLVVDSWEALMAAVGDADAGTTQELLLRLAADGPAAGLRVVITSDRTGLTGRLGASIATKICLRLADRGDFALLGVPARAVPTQMPPGRALRAADLAWLQLARADPTAWAAAQRWPAPTTPPRRFEPLPARVPLHTVARPESRLLVVGLRGDDLEPVTLDPADTGGVFLVAGPPRSGRSTTLVSIAAQLQERPVVAVCGRGPLRARRDLAVIADNTDAGAVERAVGAVADGAALLVDDVDLVDDPQVLDRLEAAVRSARDGTGFVVLAGAPDAMAASFRGPIAQARRSRSGLLLRPENPHDGELLGLRLRRRAAHSDPPGRGILAVHGRAVPVQVLDPS